VGGGHSSGCSRKCLSERLVLSPCWTAVFALAAIHIGIAAYSSLPVALVWAEGIQVLFTSDDDLGPTFILPYGTFSCADASNLLIPINRLLHVGLKTPPTPHPPTAMLQNTFHQHPGRPYYRHALLAARVRPLSQLLRSAFPFLLDFDLRETFFRRPSSRVLFFGRLQYRSFWDDSNTVWPSGDFTPFKFFFVVYFGYIPPIVYRRGNSLLWERIVFCFRVVSVSMWYRPKKFCMYSYSFDNFPSSLGSISSALALPVSRGRHAELADDFSHESDVTSLQDPFMSRPCKTPF